MYLLELFHSISARVLLFIRCQGRQNSMSTSVLSFIPASIFVVSFQLLSNFIVEVLKTSFLLLILVY